MITKNNYEEFFLLYVDNELSASEREAVEAFVMLHPDLQEELQMLQQTVLLPEPSFSFDKSSLYKSTEPVNEYNFEEKALLYIDNELPETDKQHLEAFVASNATFKPALALLQQTKLPLEVIECPNKEALYQKEDNVRPIFWIRFARIAVAAAVIGLGFIIYTVLPSKVAVNNYASTTSNQQVQTNSLKNSTVTVTKPSIESLNNSEATKAVVVETKNNAVIKNKMVEVNQITHQTNHATITTKEETGLAIHKEVNNNIQQPNIKDKDALVSVEMPTRANINELQAPNNTSLVSMVTPNENEAKNTVKTIPTVYKELDTNDDNKSLYVGNLELNKDKIRGFLRKASRLLGNKAKNEDEPSPKTSFAVNK